MANSKFKQTQVYLNLKRHIQKGDFSQEKMGLELLELIAILADRVTLNEERLFATKNFINNSVVASLNSLISDIEDKEKGEKDDTDIEGSVAERSDDTSSDPGNEKPEELMG